MFYFLFFFIVRRPWPNFVCKGRHTSSVVLYCIIVLLLIRKEFMQLCYVSVPIDNRAALPELRSSVPVVHIPQESLPGTYHSHSQSTQVRVWQIHIWSTDGRTGKRHLLPRVCVKCFLHIINFSPDWQ